MPMKRMKHKRNIRKLRGWFEKIAYASLGADIAIAIVTLIYINTSAENLLSLELVLNYVLTVIVVISLGILATIGIISMYIRLHSRGRG